MNSLPPIELAMEWRWSRWLRSIVEEAERIAASISNIACGLAAGALLLTSQSAGAQEIVIGRASVVDADTIDIREVRIRFGGIDAPESWQTCKDVAGKPYQCGKEAALTLDAFLAASRPAKCVLQRREAGYGGKRWIGEYWRADGSSVSNWLVANGLAVDWPKYSAGKYADLEAQAAARSVGMWRGSFELPCLARARRKKLEPHCF